MGCKTHTNHEDKAMSAARYNDAESREKAPLHINISLFQDEYHGEDGQWGWSAKVQLFRRNGGINYFETIPRQTPKAALKAALKGTNDLTDADD